MQQVLFFIPVQANWLPAFFPLPALVFLFFALLAAAAWFAAPRQPFQVPEESWRNAAKWIVGFGAAVAVGMFVAGRFWFPAGIPVNGFGMMLFVAFVLCNWVAGRVVIGVPFLTVASGPNRGKDYLASFPADERDRRAQDMVQDTAVVLLGFGLLGARITYLVQEGPKFNSLWDFILQLPLIWEGGIIFYGSLIGGTIAFFAWYFFKIYYRNVRIDPLKLADIAAPSLALGLCLGRIGCLLNGCCYGQVACADCAVVPIHFPLSAPARFALVGEGYQTAAGFTLDQNQPARGGALIDKVAPDSAAAVAGLRGGDRIKEVNGKVIARPEDLDTALTRDWPRGDKDLTLKVTDAGGDERTLSFAPYTIGLHPTQVYESISMFILFLMMLAFLPLRTRDGQALALLMMCYGVHRYLNELLRDDPRPKGLESNGSLILLAMGVVFFLWLYTRPARVKTA